MLALGGEIDTVVEITRYDVSAAADHGLEQLRAALEVDDFDIDAGLLIFAQRLRKHGGQVAQARPATDGERHFRLCERKARRKDERGERNTEPPD